MSVQRRAANREAERRRRPDLKEQQDRNGHGVRSTYAYWFCRCDRCTDANTRYSKLMRLAQVRAGKRQT